MALEEKPRLGGGAVASYKKAGLVLAGADRRPGAGERNRKQLATWQDLKVLTIFDSYSFSSYDGPTCCN
jgi:hypothetical protein